MSLIFTSSSFDFSLIIPTETDFVNRLNSICHFKMTQDAKYKNNRGATSVMTTFFYSTPNENFAASALRKEKRKRSEKFYIL